MPSGSNTIICTCLILLQNNNCFGCVVHDRAMFYKKKHAAKNHTNSHWILIVISVQVTKQLKYLGPVEAIFEQLFVKTFYCTFCSFLK